jgi:glycosyltransferase involved in cell wall biosynthesis
MHLIGYPHGLAGSIINIYSVSGRSSPLLIMRRLIFGWSYVEWGGAQVYFLAIMKLAKEDWDIRVILPANSLPDILEYLDQLGIPYEFIPVSSDARPAPTIKRKIERQLSRVRAQLHMYKHVRKFDLKESILHIELAPWQDWIFLTVLAMRGANVFVTMHNFLPRFPAWREAIWKARLQWVSRLPGFRIFASNHDTRNKLKGWVSEKFRERVPVTYTCINPPEIDAVLSENINKAKIRLEFGVDESDFVVITVGQFVDRKGRWVLLDAAKEVVKADGKVSFVWVMPKLPEGDELSRVESYGLGDKLRLVRSSDIGRSRHEILRFIRMADVFTLPSYVEGLPIALLEAMALGLPSISTNVYAIPEALKHEETGLLIEPGDSEALASSILELKGSEEARRRLAAAGREFVMKNFDEREASRIAIDAYKECFADVR